MNIRGFYNRPKYFATWPFLEIGALTLFTRMHSNGEKIRATSIASWHWPSSITWRWGLNYSWPTKEKPFGKIRWATQKNMFRELSINVSGK